MKTSPSPSSPPLQLWSAAGSADLPGRLLASRHRASGDVQFPPLRPVSPLAAEYETIALSEHGVLYSYTIVHSSPKAGLPPVAIGYVDFPEGVRVFGRVRTHDAKRPRIGARLRATHDSGHGYVFEPVCESDE
ncbi:MAG TPA: OB-fold domain-containing protein [Burkholderiaceae bacterium]|nr:OB-fold domain-containing protein [Burkholderiaceae bacterium]